MLVMNEYKQFSMTTVASIKDQLLTLYKVNYIINCNTDPMQWGRRHRAQRTAQYKHYKEWKNILSPKHRNIPDLRTIKHNQKDLTNKENSNYMKQEV
jgi:hypothetical protein